MKKEPIEEINNRVPILLEIILHNIKKDIVDIDMKLKRHLETLNKVSSEITSLEIMNLITVVDTYRNNFNKFLQTQPLKIEKENSYDDSILRFTRDRIKSSIDEDLLTCKRNDPQFN